MRAAIVLCVAAAALLFGCAQRPLPLSEAEAAELREPLECYSRADCDLLWRKVQAWISRNAGYKLQTVTDVVIETFNARSTSTGWAFRAIREPLGGQREVITLDPSCGEVALCGKTRAQITARFLGDMRAAR